MYNNCTSFAEAIIEARKRFGISTPDISACSRGNFGGKREELLTARYVVFENIVSLSDTGLVQFVQNRNII